MRTFLRRGTTLVVAVVIVCTVVLVRAQPAAADAGPDTYRPPVDAPVHDPFRAPLGPYGPGHRGIEYDTAPGTDVVASASGTVVFAGQVAGTQWVTIRHDGDLRTTYGPLASIAVVEGAPVQGGDVIGTTAGRLLLTARVGEDYVDPALLLASDGVHLVAEPRALPLFSSSSFGLGDVFPPDVIASGLRWTAGVAEEQLEAVYGVTPGPVIAHSVRALVAWRQRQGHCTPPGAAAPSLSTRHLAVLVGGLGSSSASASVDDVDTPGLGYGAGDVVRFSYAGGRVPTSRTLSPALDGLPVSQYSPGDTTGDVTAAGQRLAQLLAQAVAAAPSGAVVDVYAHSLGGLVVRAALVELEANGPAVLGRIGTVVTLATPHQGAELAGLVDAIDGAPVAGSAADEVAELTGTELRADDRVFDELAPGSDFLRRLDGHPPPSGPDYLSVAGQSDLVVPSPDAVWDGAQNVVVPAAGLGAHAGLPGSGAATREIALALARLPPSCESASDAVLDAVWGDVLHNGERFLAAADGH